MSLGRRTYLVEYGQVSFRNRNLGHGALGRRGPAPGDPGGVGARRRPPGARGRLEPRRHLHHAHRRRPARPADRLPDRPRLPGRREEGAAGRAGATAAQPHRRARAADPQLPRAGRDPAAAGQLGLHRRVGAEGPHQAGGRADPPRRQRLPRPARGGRPLHGQHDRLPRAGPSASSTTASSRATRSPPGRWSSATAASSCPRSPRRCWSSPAPPTASRRSPPSARCSRC